MCGDQKRHPDLNIKKKETESKKRTIKIALSIKLVNAESD